MFIVTKHDDSHFGRFSAVISRAQLAHSIEEAIEKTLYLARFHGDQTAPENMREEITENMQYEASRPDGKSVFIQITQIDHAHQE